MQFRSTLSSEPQIPLIDAVLRCLPSDGGLYVPSQVIDLRQYFLHMDEKTSYKELISTLTPVLLQGALGPEAAARVALGAYDFEPQLQHLDDKLSVLRLYVGPSGTFKDFGVSFLASLLEELIGDQGQGMIISAVRGDSGINLERAFRGRRGLTSVMLYPSGTILGLDPSYYVSQGGNIIPIQIRGTLDDCQRLVTEIIHDRPFAERHGISSANAINPGRLFPQVFYYLYAFTAMRNALLGDLVFSVPSGNFGNLISGLYAWKFGLPVYGFIAAMNGNNSFGDFIRGGKYQPQPLLHTLSPALDVSIPSNYERLSSFYQEAPAVMRNMVFPASVDDQATVKAMEQAWKEYGLILDPHGAVAFGAAREYLKSPENADSHVVVLATGHPAREAALVEKVTGQRVALPEKLQRLKQSSEPLAIIDPQLEALEAAIASCI